MGKMTVCKTCGADIASSAKTCPKCGAKIKTPIYKKVWFWVIIAFFVIGAAAGGSGENKSYDTASNEQPTTVKEETVETKAAKTAPATSENAEPEKSKEPEEEPKEEPEEEQVSKEFKNAYIKAETYYKMMHMSKAAVYDQLTSEYGENFEADAAQYAVDKLDETADWNDAALQKAKTYQDQMNMSKSSIYEQLTSEYGENFTAEQAQYAIDNLPD